MTGASHEDRLDQILDETVETERSRPQPDADAFLERLRPQLTTARPGNGPQGWGQLTTWKVAALIPVIGAVVLTIWLASDPEPVPQEVADSQALEELELLEELDLYEDLAEILTAEDLDASDFQAIDLETVKLLEDWELLLDLEELPDELLESSG